MNSFSISSANRSKKLFQIKKWILIVVCALYVLYFGVGFALCLVGFFLVTIYFPIAAENGINWVILEKKLRFF